MINLRTFNEQDFERYMRESEPIVKVLPPRAWTDEIAYILKNGVTLSGATMPWQKTHNLIRFRPCEVTLWQGISGHGKSLMLGQVIAGFMNQNEPACIASFEMKPAMTYLRMLRQVAGCERPSIAFNERLLDWLDQDRMWIYDHQGSVAPEQVFAAIRYSAHELKVKHFVVDNIMKCVRNEDDYSGQKMFVDRVCALARENSIHIHLVHHVRKGQNEYDIPGKFDARGSGTIVDQVDQVMTVWRNKQKSDILAKEPENEKFKNEPDAALVVAKNRHGDWEGKISLWFHKDSLQYTPDNRCLPLTLIRELA
jgi:twinkle protein